jgi:hypothetical protein
VVRDGGAYSGAVMVGMEVILAGSTSSLSVGTLGIGEQEIFLDGVAITGADYDLVVQGAGSRVNLYQGDEVWCDYYSQTAGTLAVVNAFTDDDVTWQGSLAISGGQIDRSGYGLFNVIGDVACSGTAALYVDINRNCGGDNGLSRMAVYGDVTVTGRTVSIFTRNSQTGPTGPGGTFLTCLGAMTGSFMYGGSFFGTAWTMTQDNGAGTVSFS